MNCICCQKQIDLIETGHEEQPYCALNDASWLEIDPGYGSKFDHISQANWYAVICDDCIEKNKENIQKYHRCQKITWQKQENFDIHNDYS